MADSFGFLSARGCWTEIDRGLADRAAQFEKYFRIESREASLDGKLSDEALRDELEEFSQALPRGTYVVLSGTEFTFRYPDVTPPDPKCVRVFRKQFTASGETYTLEAGERTDHVTHTLDLLRTLLLSFLPLVIAIACACGYWLSGRALRPVREITAAAGAISIENLGARLPVPDTADEIASLTVVLNSMLARLEAAVKTLSQFVADASHELRTPLSVIRTTAELALRRPRQAESYRDSLQEIAAETERMTQLVEDLLALARSDTGSVEMPLDPVEVRGIVEDVCGEVRRLAELRTLRIHAELGDRDITIAGNRAALHRLFLVVLDNALKFSPAGSTVNVGLRIEEASVIVSIEDFGCGIRAEDLPHIFKRFYRADRARSGGGYGLGLSLAESIARSHGAEIEVRTGASTIFEIRFAFSQSSASPRMLAV